MIRRFALAATAILLAAAAPLHATTYNSPTVDDGVPPFLDQGTGTNVGDTSWATDEVLVVSPPGDGGWGPFNDLQSVWVTWDADGVYFSVTGAIWDTASGVGANSVNLYIDADYGQGTGVGDFSQIAQEALGAVSRNFWRPLTVGSGFGLDWGYTTWAGRFDLGFLDVSDAQAPVNLFQGVTDGQSVNTHTSAEGVIESRDIVGNSGYELFVPWAVLYPAEAAGRVPAGTRIALVVAQVGGGDSLSPESLPLGADVRAIERPLVFTVDGNGDGVPDVDWPPSGSIAGTVTLDDPLDTTTVVDVIAKAGGAEVARVSTAAGGGDYLIDRLGPGIYEISVESTLYFTTPQTVSLGENQDLTGVDFLAEKINSGIDFVGGFSDGPEATTRTLSIDYAVTRTSDGVEVASGTILSTDPLNVRVAPVLAGTYEMSLVARSEDPTIGTYTGYKPRTVALTVVEDEFLDAGTLQLSLVVPERVVYREHLSEGFGGALGAQRIPESLPSLDFYARVALDVAVVDADGDEALLTPALLDAISFRALSIDPRFPPFGIFDYWTLSDDSAPVATTSDTPALSTLDPSPALPTRASFRISSYRDEPQTDPLEVLRLRASHATLAGTDLEVKVVPRLPASVGLTANATQMTAGGEIDLVAQLLDINGNDSPIADVDIRFEVTPNSGGRATVVPSETTTESDGSAGRSGGLRFVSDLAGTFEIQAVAFNGIEDIFADEVITVTVAADAPDHLELSAQQVSENLARAAVTLTDQYGNAIVGGTPRTVDVSASPSVLVVSAPATVTVDETGQGSFDVTFDSNLSGFLELGVSLAGLPVPEASTRLRLLRGLAAYDEAAPESDDAHNADPGIDLTAMYATIDGEDLVVTLPFSSNFNGAHMVLLIETQNDGAGAFSDAFAFPVSYAHSVLPDYVFTYKYAADDYADMRRPAGAPGSWEWHNWTTGGWAAAFEDGVDAKAAGRVSKTDSEVRFLLPLDVIAPGFTPGVDAVRLQAYVTQEDGDKRPALDSVPHDATVDMLPATGNWYDPSNLVPTTLSQWAEVVPAIAPASNLSVTASVEPIPATQGEMVLLTAQTAFEGTAPTDPILQLLANLSGVTGDDTLVPLVDDGSGPDEIAGDGVWSVEFRVPDSIFEGEYDVTVEALELTTSQSATGTASVQIVGTPELTPLLTVTDPAGDDHGPNQPGEQFLYYEYPTSGVFFDGVFDLRQLDVFDAGDRLLFRVTLTDITSPAEPGAADWNAVYPSDANCPADAQTDLNLQNVIILLDTSEGNNVGSTRLPDNRRADVAAQDAWEYALVFDGWWKGLVKSNGSSAQANWETIPDDRAWFFCASAATNTIEGFLDKSELSESEIANLLNWDIIVALAGHDGDSNRDNWGQVRWVNEGRSQEWNFGGGRAGEDNRDRDANFIDLITHAGLRPNGEPKPAGLPQEVQMDYLRPEAIDRFADDETAVRLEATSFVDNVPPQVNVRGIVPERAVVPWAILQDSPVVIRAEIVDAAGVDEATLYWRGAGEAPAANRSVNMGQLRRDLEPTGTEWVADLRWEDVEAATDDGPLTDPDNLADTVRYIVVGVEAVDAVGNSTSDAGERLEQVIELPLEPVTQIDTRFALSAVDGTQRLDLNEGSILDLQESTLQAIAGDDSSASFRLLLEPVSSTELDFSFRSDKNPTILGPDDRYLGIARRLNLSWIDGNGQEHPIDKLPETARLSLHFPSYAMGDTDPADLQFFRWNEVTERWVLLGAHGERGGATVTADVNELGTFGVFATHEEIDRGKLVTGLQLSPNPFSPNGDGLYDELNITYVLPFETASTVVEVFDVRGKRLRVLRLFDADLVTGRTPGLIWDGKDEEGREVPMGIYILRVEVREEGGASRVERATEAVAVVR